MRILGLDYGARTVGIAISDGLQITAQGLEIVKRDRENKLRRTFVRIEELILEYGVEQLVLGFPKNMDNSIGERGEKTLAFKERLALSLEFQDKLERRTGLPVVLWDERLTTVAADQAMTEAGIRFEKRKEYVDRIAAAIILQGYLDYCRNGGLNLQ